IQLGWRAFHAMHSYFRLQRNADGANLFQQKVAKRSHSASPRLMIELDMSRKKPVRRRFSKYRHGMIFIGLLYVYNHSPTIDKKFKYRDRVWKTKFTVAHI